MTHTKNTIQLALVAALIAALAGCDSGKAAPAAPFSAAQGVQVRVDPGTATIAHGASTQLNALVTGASVSTVSWSIVEPGTVGTVTQAGLYTAPTTASGTFHVRATSTVDDTAHGDAAITVAPACTSFTYSAWGTCTNGTQTRTVATSVPAGCMGGASPVLSQSCTVAPACTGYTYSAWGTCTNGTQARTVLTSIPTGCTGGASPVLSQSCTAGPVTLTISPKTTTVDACTQRSFTASVSNTSNLNVNWSVQEVGGGSVANGVYTAPAMAGTYHVVATSVVDPTAIDTATVTVADKVLSVTVAPASATVAPGGTQQFVATIRTTCTTYTSATN
jgi:hypothetical protein